VKNKINRRNFLEVSSAGIGAAGILGTAADAKAQSASIDGKPARFGFIGVGDRGSYHLDIALGIDGVEVPAICDINDENLHRAARWIKDSGRKPPKLYGKTRTDFERMCAEEDLDCVVCCTSWKWHAPILLSSMRNGKNSVCEVPLIQTLEEAWEIVETYEKTGKWATLGLKIPYSTLSNLVYEGVLGEITHCEGGYVHDLRLVKFDPEREPWRLQPAVDRNANLYPDHPTCALMPSMDINHTDRFDYLVSMSSRSVMLNRYAELLYGPENDYATKKFKLGDANVTLLRTVNGKLYTLHHDTHTPHPREFKRVQGTKGVMFSLGQDLGRFIHLDGMPADKWEPIAPYYERYRHPLEKAYQPKPRKAIRGHGAGESITPLFWDRLITALREKRETDLDTYDSVTSSAIIPLTEASVAKNGEPIDFPDFTKGKWKTRPRVEEAFRKRMKA
jgi:predicted dehydrogenase